jgi:hypothetical protein
MNKRNFIKNTIGLTSALVLSDVPASILPKPRKIDISLLKEKLKAVGIEVLEDCLTPVLKFSDNTHYFAVSHKIKDYYQPEDEIVSLLKDKNLKYFSFYQQYSSILPLCTSLDDSGRDSGYMTRLVCDPYTFIPKEYSGIFITKDYIRFITEEFPLPKITKNELEHFCKDLKILGTVDESVAIAIKHPNNVSSVVYEVDVDGYKMYKAYMYELV